MHRFKVYVILFNGNRVHTEVCYGLQRKRRYGKESHFNIEMSKTGRRAPLNVYKTYTCLCRRRTHCAFAGNGIRTQNAPF